MNGFLPVILGAFIALSVSKNVFSFYPGDGADWKTEIKAAEVLIESANKESDMSKMPGYVEEIETHLDNAAKTIGLLGEEENILKLPESKDERECFIKQILIRLKERKIVESIRDYASLLANRDQRNKALEILTPLSKICRKCEIYISYAREKDKSLLEKLEDACKKFLSQNKEEDEAFKRIYSDEEWLGNPVYYNMTGYLRDAVREAQNSVNQRKL